MNCSDHTLDTSWLKMWFIAWQFRWNYWEYFQLKFHLICDGLWLSHQISVPTNWFVKFFFHSAVHVFVFQEHYVSCVWMFLFLSCVFFFFWTPRCHAFMPQFCVLSIPYSAPNAYTQKHVRLIFSGFGLRVAQFFFVRSMQHEHRQPTLLRYEIEHWFFFGTCLEIMTWWVRGSVKTPNKHNIGNQHSI